ncbi:uncharacterized protein LOC142982358 [Anticarsia gemmatalis]|uniref:uncharacterized protein LOC142982358 n=1 Tax=Anticarsia gemmatalis TaxID=129554 RepID=UPI003F768226
MAINMPFGQQNLLKYWSAMKTCDTIMGFKKIPLIPYYAPIFVSIAVSIASIVMTFSPPLTLTLFFFRFFAFLSMDFNYLYIIIVFAILHYRLKLLRQFLEKNSIPVIITRNCKVSNSVRNVRKSLYNYNRLLDNLLIVDSQLQYLLVSCLAITFPGFVIKTYIFVKKMLQRTSPMVTLFYTTDMAQTFYSICCPAIIVELAMYEVKNIKTTLTKQMINCPDVAIRSELEAALKYITLRPFSYRIGRIIPLNVDLLSSYLSLVITYVIVLMQLTHAGG